jgi:predicted phage baseplate assembly protein
MTAPWWTREASPDLRQQSPAVAAAPTAWPQLVVADREAVYNEWINRASSYTSEWTNRRATDAGIAVANLFSEEMEPVLQRVNQLAENAFIQFLTTGGVQPLPPTPAEAMLQFTVSSAATQSIYVGRGFQVGASAADGSGLVTFETNDDLYALPGAIQEIYCFEEGFYSSIDPTQASAFQPFGPTPKAGFAFFIGISAPPGISVGPRVSLGIQVQGPAGEPPPVSTGGTVPLPQPLAPLLEWDVLDGTTYRQAEIVSDKTDGLVQSGVVTLGLPDSWSPGIPAGTTDTTPLLWLRLQIMYGTYDAPPTLLSVTLNVVGATAVQTFRNEVLTPVSSTSATSGVVMALSQTPVLPGSLILKVVDTADMSFSASTLSPASASSSSDSSISGQTWNEVDDLAEFDSADQVYVLDSATGQVTFGDGIHGMALPPGFRNVVAQKYQVGGGSAGSVGAGQINNPINSVPYISGVQNPLPATGGMDAETQQQTLQRGARELRAHGRAVAIADYEILALRATGALVARAGAVAGFHPSFPGTFIPGVVCVFVIPPELGSGPPIPDAGTLLAVSTYLSSNLAPVGVEIVAAAPVYHTVSVEASVVIDPSVSRNEAVQSVISLCDSYLDPITGGDDGLGWPFGGTLSNVAFVRQLLTVEGITAVPSLLFIVDGIRGQKCGDVSIPANSLVWPQDHNILALGPGEEP